MCMKLLAEDNMLQLVNINFDTIIFTLINTLIIFLLYKFLLHNKVMAVLDERKEKVNSEMNAAEAAQAEAEAVKQEYAQRLEQSKEEASQIVAAAVKRAGEREAEIIAQANQEADQIRMNALLYTNDLLKAAEISIENAYKASMEHYHGLTETLRVNLEIVKSNRSELNVESMVGQAEQAPTTSEEEVDAFLAGMEAGKQRDEFGFDENTFLKDV